MITETYPLRRSRRGKLRKKEENTEPALVYSVCIQETPSTGMGEEERKEQNNALTQPARDSDEDTS